MKIIDKKDLKETRSLVLIDVLWNGKNAFTLTYPGGSKVFNGTPEGFTKFLRKIGAREASTYPRSARYKTYPEMVNDIISGSGTNNIWVWSNSLAALKGLVFTESEKIKSKEGFFIWDDETDEEIEGPFTTEKEAQKEIDDNQDIYYNTSVKFLRESKIKESEVNNYGGFICVYSDGSVVDEKTEETWNFDDEEEAEEFAYKKALERGYIQESYKVETLGD